MAARDDFDLENDGDDLESTPMTRKRSLPLIGKASPPSALAQDMDIEAELAAFEAAERERLGLFEEREHWKDEMIDSSFKRSERDATTLLVCGLTMAHDFLIEGALKGLGYNVMHLEVPNNAALQYGKEFGNRGQCNPTYYTVGNLVKFLCEKRDAGMTSEEVIKKYIFVTAGACGPCRFGMYVTEYRKALRDAGFDGFRVMLFQQTGGFAQATGEEVGLEMNSDFFITLTKAALCGDVLNALVYRIRPYEVVAGEGDKAMEEAKRIVYQAFAERTSIYRALYRVRKVFGKVKVDKLRAKPKVSIIGEFWAMTTEGDGNYQLQRFLESEGGEPDIQLVTAWLLYMLWEGRHDTQVRQDLRGADHSKYGLGELGTTGVAKRMATLRLAETLARVSFQSYAKVAGLSNYHLPDMDQIAEVAAKYYNNDLRGGEGHMEVGKLILNSLKRKANMTLSVKPFGCMPSASVSDGIQSLITEKFPGSIFCAVETSGDGRVNFYSRIQMYIFKARAAAELEFQTALDKYGLTKEQVAEFLEKNPKYASPLYRADHVDASTAADMVHAVAPLMTQTRWQRAKNQAARAWESVQKTGPALVNQAKQLQENFPEMKERVAADLEVVSELLQGKVAAFSPLAEKLLYRAMQPDGGGEMVSHPVGAPSSKASTNYANAAAE
jgi:predicted nucleotide-binding protein (sugar kinase/HSP70/actin superfamily)